MKLNVRALKLSAGCVVGFVGYTCLRLLFFPQPNYDYAEHTLVSLVSASLLYVTIAVIDRKRT